MTILLAYGCCQLSSDLLEKLLALRFWDWLSGKVLGKIYKAIGSVPKIAKIKLKARK